MVARMMMGASAVFEPLKPRFGVMIVPGAPHPPRMTPARPKALEIAADGLIRSKSALAEASGCTSGVIDGLVKSGCLVEVAIPDKVYPRPNPAQHGRRISATPKRRPSQTLQAGIDGRAFSASLLDGVTGSGKTEVYFEAVARALMAGVQVVILLPEIALTSQFMDRFKARFGCAPAEWHSALSPQERARVWRAAATGEARVIVGARSALFLPYRDLGLIVVDEEHDQSFKQDDRVHYQGRDMAVVRAALGKFSVVLASATPSIESHVNARTGKYRHIVLPGRFSGVEMPDVKPIDMRTRSAGQGPLDVAAAGRSRHRDARKRPAIPAVSQSPRLRAADAVPQVRPSLRMSAVCGVAGRASLQEPAQLPPLRFLGAAAEALPVVQ